jgi:putative membrane protein
MGRRRPYRCARNAQEAVMTAIGRRSILIASLLVPVVHIPLALAVDALPDARFVGFAQAVNDFDLASGQMALQRSANENIRGYATRIIADANYDASALRLSSSEAGVSYAPDGSMGPKTNNLLAQLNTLQGPAFDTAFAQGQLSVQIDCEAQYGAYSQNGKSGPLRRYAQNALPKAKERLDLARRLAGGR